MTDLKHLHVSILKRQFDPVLQMLQKCIEQCSEDLWFKEEENGSPYWQQLYHATFFIDFWLREVYSQDVEYRSMIFEKTLEVDLAKQSVDYLTKEELDEYLTRIQVKIDQFFVNLTDSKLITPIMERTDMTFLDVILSQIRHVQYHVGRCNCLLKQHNLQTVKWIAYNEKH